MSEIVALIRENQIQTISAFLILGSIGTIALLTTQTHPKIWKVVDLLWILVGGTSAATALFLSLYISETQPIQREIDIASSGLRSLARTARSYRSRWCATDTYQSNRFGLTSDNGVYEEVIGLCATAATIQTGAEREFHQLKAIGYINAKSSNPDIQDYGRIFEELSIGWIGTTAGALTAWETGSFLLSSKYGPTDRDILKARVSFLKSAGFQVLGAEFENLFSEYTELVAEATALRDKWKEASRREYLLFLRLVSVAVFALAFPFRIGKSAHDIMCS